MGETGFTGAGRMAGAGRYKKETSESAESGCKQTLPAVAGATCPSRVPLTCRLKARAAGGEPGFSHRVSTQSTEGSGGKGTCHVKNAKLRGRTLKTPTLVYYGERFPKPRVSRCRSWGRIAGGENQQGPPKT